MPAPRRLASLVAAVLMAALVAVPAAAASPQSALHRTGLIPTPITRNGLTPYAQSLTAATAVYPTSVDLSADAPAVGNQGQVGSCTAWASGYYGRYWLRHHAIGDTTLFAPMYTYAQIAKGVDTGSSYPSNFSIMINQGISPMATYTWGNYDYTDQPTSTDVANAGPYKATGYSQLWSGYSTNNTTAVQATLAGGQPVYLEIPVYPEFDNASSSNPFIDVPKVGETSRGWHAVFGVKYDANGVWIENSWGTGWGAAGWGELSWAFINGYTRAGWTFSGGLDVPSGTTVVSSFSPSAAAVGSTVTINGLGFTGATAVTFNGTSATFTVLSDSQISATVPAGASSGQIAVTGVNNTGSSASAFTVTLPTTTLSYTGTTTTTAGAAITLSAHLQTAGGTALGSRTVRFGLNGTTYSGSTDVNGNLSMPATAPVAGTYPITVNFDGDGTNQASSTSSSLSVAKVATSVKYTGPTSMAHGATVNLTATLKTSAGVGIFGATVTFTFAGKTYTTTTTTGGLASVSVVAPTGKTAQKVTVSYAGSATYAASSTTVNVKVQ